MTPLQQRILGAILIISSILWLVRLFRTDISQPYKLFKKRWPRLYKVIAPDEFFYAQWRGVLPALVLIVGLPLLNLPRVGYVLVGALIVGTFAAYIVLRAVRGKRHL